MNHALSVFVASFALFLLPAMTSAQEAMEPTTYRGPKEKLHIYLLVGQSNMSGRAKIEDQDRKIPGNLFLLDSQSKWVGATHPFIQYTNVPNSADLNVIKAQGKSGLNLGLAFARKMLQASDDVSIGLVVNSQGGSAIKTWLRDGKNYEKTMDRVRTAKVTGIVKGVLWHQGESDLAMGDAYLDSLAKVVSQFRDDLGDAKLPFVVGQLAPLPKEKKAIDAFNQALLQFPVRVRTSAVVRTEGFRGDDIHFGNVETRRLGEMYAAEMLNLQAK